MKNKSIGEVAKEVGVEIHTIRFWTDEFAEYIPFEIGKGERRYYPEDAINVFKRINHLIHKDGIRIKSIKEKKMLLASKNQVDSSSNAELLLKIDLLEKKLKFINENLSKIEGLAIDLNNLL